MQILDYLPAVLAFTFAILGIVAKSKDDSKDGFRRITTAGWLFLSLSAVSFVFGAYTIRSKHLALDKRAAVADIARGRIVDGLNALLRPLCGSEEAFSAGEAGSIFDALRTEENLLSVGKQRAVKWPGTAGGVVSQLKSFPYREFDDLYQLNDYYVSAGESAISNILSAFGGYLSEDEIVALSTVLSDPFLNGSYHLTGLSTTYFAQGLDDEKRTGEQSPWTTLGLYYFSAGKTQPAIDFLAKAEDATSLVLAKRTEHNGFRPCQH